MTSFTLTTLIAATGAALAIGFGAGIAVSSQTNIDEATAKIIRNVQRHLPGLDTPPPAA